MSAFLRKYLRSHDDNASRIGANEMSLIQAFPFLAILSAVGYQINFGMGCDSVASRVKVNQNAMTFLCSVVETNRDHPLVASRIIGGSPAEGPIQRDLFEDVAGFWPNAFTDAWGNDFAISVTSSEISIESAGPDAMNGTGDDMQVQCADRSATIGPD